MKNKLFIIGLSLFIAVCIFSGCASTGGDGKEKAEPGTLTITGIPAEYNGKFASFSRKMSDQLAKINLFASATDVSKVMSLEKVEGAVITNGEVKLLLFKPSFLGYTAFTDSKTFRIELCIKDTAASDQDSKAVADRYNGWAPDFIFPAITFKDGVAEVKLDDAFKVGYLTITGIPGVYNNSGANIRFNRPDEKKKGVINIYDTTGNIKNGTLTVKYYRDREDTNYMPYTGTAEIIVNMGSAQDQGAVDMMILGVKDVAIRLKLLFKVQMTNDNATVSFSEGIKQ